MMPELFLFSFIISTIFLGAILFLIRSRKLREQYALLWLILSLIMMLLSLFPKLIDLMAGQLGVDYAPSLLYLLGLVSLLFILLHLTMAVSSLTRQMIVLTQTVALLEQQVDQLRINRDDIP